LGFKGGTACYFFYNLPRFSTDLDFNLIKRSQKDYVFNEIEKIINKYGEVADKYIKRNTIFFFLVHTKERSGIKIEISTREYEKYNKYELKEFFGASIKTMKKEYMFASKLIALTKRPKTSARDLYDINFFFKENWDIAEDLIENIMNKSLVEYLSELPDFINNNFNTKNISMGLGELVNNQSQRDFIKRHLIEDTKNQILFYISSLRRNI